MSNLRGVKVGDTLYVEADRRIDIRSTICTAVGRKWVSCDDREKYDIDTGCNFAGQYISRYRAYPSMEAIKEKRIRVALWAEADKMARGFSAREYSDETLYEIMRLLGNRINP